MMKLIQAEITWRQLTRLELQFIPFKENTKARGKGPIWIKCTTISCLTGMNSSSIITKEAMRKLLNFGQIQIRGFCEK
jgi:hypothetical protein